MDKHINRLIKGSILSTICGLSIWGSYLTHSSNTYAKIIGVQIFFVGMYLVGFISEKIKY